MKYTSPPLFSNCIVLATITPAVCPIASTIKTPGIIGLDGKCPWKKGSLNVTFFIPTALSPNFKSFTLSINNIG